MTQLKDLFTMIESGQRFEIYATDDEGEIIASLTNADYITPEEIKKYENCLAYQVKAREGRLIIKIDAAEIRQAGEKPYERFYDTIEDRACVHAYITAEANDLEGKIHHTEEIIFCYRCANYDEDCGVCIINGQYEREYGFCYKGRERENERQ